MDKQLIINLISPEEFSNYAAMLSEKTKLEKLGISITSNEKLSQSVSVVINEFSAQDKKITYLAGLIEEKVALAKWNISSCYFKGKNKKNFQVKGRGDPTCGKCGYSYELFSKFTREDQKTTEQMLRKTLKQEIKLLGKSEFHEQADESDEEPFFFEFSNDITNKENIIDEDKCLADLITSISNFSKEKNAGIRKVLKRTTSYPMLSGKILKKVEFITDSKEIELFSTKKKVIPKIFVIKPKISKEELEKRAREQEEKKIQKTLEIERRKTEKKLERAREKLIKEQEWKKICIEKYNSGAVLFNTGTNSNIKCSRCHMIGHQKTNKKLCPAYIEEKTENIGQIDEKIDSKIVLNLEEIKKQAKIKKPKKPKKTFEIPEVKRKKNRREIDEFQEVVIKLIENQNNKEYFYVEDGLLSMLEKCEKGHNWTFAEFFTQLEKLFGDEFSEFSEQIEEMLNKKPKIPDIPVTKPKKKQQKIMVFEEEDTLIINTMG